MPIDRLGPTHRSLAGTTDGGARAPSAAEAPAGRGPVPAGGGRSVLERVALASAGAGATVLGGTSAASLALNGYGIVTLGSIVAALGGGPGLLATGLGVMAGSVLPMVGGVMLAVRLFRSAAERGPTVDP